MLDVRGVTVCASQVVKVVDFQWSISTYLQMRLRSIMHADATALCATKNLLKENRAVTAKI